MATYQLIQTTSPDAPARYSANGKRVSREEYERIADRAFREGKLECFQTIAKQLPGGRIKRKNFSIARW